MLYTKYSDPSSFLDQVIRLNRLSETVDKIMEFDNEQKLWELYLACVGNSFREIGSFEDFKESAKPPEKIDVEATIQDSFSILSDFHPERG